MKQLTSKTKNIYLGSLLGALLLAIPAHAASAGGGIVGSPNDRLVESDTECAGCPATPKTGGVVSFDALETLFVKSKAPSNEALSGDWKMILKVSHPELVGDAAFSSTRDGGSNEGFKNASNEYWRALHFETQDSGWGEEANNTVSLTGFGSFRTEGQQGPFAVAFREQSACFAHYGYAAYRYSDPGSGMNDASPMSGSYVRHLFADQVANATYSYACRTLSARGNRLICAVTPHGTAFTTKQKPWVGRVIEYVGYEKIK